MSHNPLEDIVVPSEAERRANEAISGPWRRRADHFERQLMQAEKKNEMLKVYNWFLIAAVVILLWAIADLNGCVRHTGDTSEQLPY